MCLYFPLLQNNCIKGLIYLKDEWSGWKINLWVCARGCIFISEYFMQSYYDFVLLSFSLFLPLTASCKGQCFTELALHIIIWLCLPYSNLTCLDAGLVNWAAWIAGHQMCLWIFVWMSVSFIKSSDTNIINVLLYHRSNWFCINCDNAQKCWHPGEQWFSWEGFETWLN